MGTNDSAGSRFSQWFKRDSPPLQQSQQRDIKDELLNNLLNDISEPNIQIPAASESNKYFAPISPAAHTHMNNNAVPSSHQQSSASTGIKLLEMLQRNNKPPSQNGPGEAPANVIQSMMKNASIKEMGKLQQDSLSSTCRRIIFIKNICLVFYDLGGGKVVSLEELEARMRGGMPSQPEPPKPKQSDEDLTAFKKLVSSLTTRIQTISIKICMKHK